MNNQTFKRIYTGDYTNIGHQQGVADGKKGTAKTHWGVLTKRHLLNFLWQPDTAHNSYVSGYNKMITIMVMMTMITWICQIG